MKSFLKTSVSLAAVATVAAGLFGAAPAAAQDAASIQAIQQQIQNLQSQLKRVQSDSARRDAELKRAQDDAAQARVQAEQAQKAAAAMPVVAPAPVQPLLPHGAFRVGGVTVTLGGFVAAEGLYRSRNQAAGIDTSFNGGIPLPNSPNYHIPETRLTAQQSRFSLLAEGQADDADKLTSYMETDFLSAGSSSNSNQSNSYTLRMRQFWAGWDNSDYGLHVMGGQGWSLATMNRAGMLPRQENVPLTIDAQYVVGFDWERQAEFRVVKDFYDHRLWAGISVEEPQTIFGSAAGNNCLTGATAGTGGGGTLEYAQCGGPNVNSIQSYSNNYAPDIIAKFAADPGWGHYEAYGLMRFLGGRVSYAATGTGTNYDTVGAGVGGGMILPLVPKKLEFQVSGLFGRGVGRYGSAQLPDVTFSPTGKIEALQGYSVMGGFVGHPTPSLDIYAYGGAEGVQQKSFATGGYGNPTNNLAGCMNELGSCSANTSGITEGTIGAWWRFFKGDYGTMQVGGQYEYIKRNTFAGTNGKGGTLSPSGDENVFLVSFRYLPFQ